MRSLYVNTTYLCVNVHSVLVAAMCQRGGKLKHRIIDATGPSLYAASLVSVSLSYLIILVLSVVNTDWDFWCSANEISYRVHLGLLACT